MKSPNPMPVLSRNPVRHWQKPQNDRDGTEGIVICAVHETEELIRLAARWNAQRMIVWMFYAGMRPCESVRFWSKPEWGWNLIDMEEGTIQVAETHLGPGSLALFCGSQPGFSADAVWYYPCIEDVAEPEGLPPLRFDEKNPRWITSEKIIRACVELSRGSTWSGEQRFLALKKHGTEFSKIPATAQRLAAMAWSILSEHNDYAGVSIYLDVGRAARWIGPGIALPGRAVPRFESSTSVRCGAEGESRNQEKTEVRETADAVARQRRVT